MNVVFFLIFRLLLLSIRFLLQKHYSCTHKNRQRHKRAAKVTLLRLFGKRCKLHGEKRGGIYYNNNGVIREKFMAE